MRGIEFQQAYDETLEALTVRRRRNLRAAIVPLVGVVAWVSTLVAIGPLSFYGMLSIGVGLGVLLWLVPKLAVAVKAFEITLTQNEGALSVDGELLESARVETRVLFTYFTKNPKGYSLSLWMLFSQGGSRDVELGRFSNLLEASQASWTIEAFLATASTRSKSASHVR